MSDRTMEAVSNLVHQSAKSIHTGWTWTRPHVKHPGNQNPEHTVEKGKHYHGKPRLWMIRVDQTSSHCELLYNAVRRGKTQSSADLRQRAWGTLSMALGLQHPIPKQTFL